MSNTLTEITPIAAGTDFFAVLGVPRSLNLDAKSVENAFYALSRRYHPDRFATADAKARIASLEATSLINRAYKTLREPWARARYLVELEGLPEAATQPPMALFEEILDLQESLGDLRLAMLEGEASEALGAHVHALAKPFREAYTATQARLQQLADEWDAVRDAATAERNSVLASLASVLGDRRYLQRVNDDVDAALQGKPATRDM